MNTTSIISLDLGGKNTGFFSCTTNDFNNLKNFQSGTIIYDESFILSQVNRRGKRHTKRNNLRRKLAKRLFLLILKEHYKLKIKYLPDEILALFNKRGYTYASFELSSEEQESLFSNILKEFLNENLGNFNISNDIEIEDFLNQIASNENTFKQYSKDFLNLYESSTFKPKNKIELKDEIKNIYEDKEDQKELFDGLKTVKKTLEEFDKQQNQGNLPRAKYFLEIKEEIKTNSNIQNFLKNSNLEEEKINNLIGNISNFQLKELRRYFNDKEMVQGDIWIEDKLHKIVWRFITSWHPKKDETIKKNQDELTSNLKNSKIIDFLTQNNPNKTIPPYDDMNNRGAVKCKSLRLNKNYLDTHLPNWRNITNRLASDSLKENLKDCTTNKSDIDLTLLHRLLDTSSSIDSYKLREYKIENYVDILGKDDSLKFKKFTQNYYETITKKVRTGIWQKADEIFELCNHNPPYKNNQIHTLVNGILGVEISDTKFKEFEETLWNKKIGNKKLVNYCKNIEELRKKKGNLFKLYIEELKEIEKPDIEQKKDIKILNDEQLLFWVDEIANFFKLDDIFKSRFSNYFSMAQLYSIIETKRAGFMSTCKWCSAENSFRTKTNIENFTLYDKSTGEKLEDVIFDENIHIKVYENSNAQRLPADTQRPFSGKIEKYIDKLGYEIAKIKAKELENIKEKKIDLKIVLEQNSFEYEESIRSAKIKNANAKAKKGLEDSKKFFEKSIEEKEKRIKNFNNKICLYCNNEITTDGEIDHILPRSYTLKNYGTVFNSEGNLLYVHQKCNQSKSNKIYKLEDIKASINVNEVEEQISKIKSYKTFTLLNQKQQEAFKFALFLPNSSEAYKKVLGFLRTDQSSRVNGTQKYLAKKIQEKLIKMFEKKGFKFDFEFILASSEDVSRLRKDYAKQNPILEKPKDSKQSPSSHTIDAVVALSSVFKKVTGLDDIPTSNKVLEFVQINNIPIKPLGKIEKEKIGNLGNGSIFKDSIYQENFAPIYKFENRFYTGFLKASKVPDFKNCIEIKSSDFEQIKKYFKNEIKKENGLVIYQINKQNTLDLFHNISNNLSNQLNLAQTLNKFSYNLIKTSVENAPKILKDSKKTSTKIYGKTLILPIKDEWERFDSFFKKELINQNIEYKEKDGKYQVDNEILISICKKYFNIQNKNIRNKARKVFSLPSVEAPSGGFRIRRKNHKNEDIYQLVGIDGAKSAGFVLENGKINSSKDVLLPTLVKSKNISFKEPAKKEIQEYIDMNNFRNLTDFINLENISIFVAPASTNRPLVKVELDFNLLKKILKNENLNFLELDNIKLEDEQKEIFDEVFNSCNFVPRDNKIKILKADSNRVLIEFSNNNKTIMKYYDKAEDINI
ncbi:type II-B CRISPR-associated RNA-guided endonuclease Cas9/Csx12 [Aliarcobacter thereius]|uniref:Type II-B CRISPR-associated RNA-guided endonuclease Cas9/Csx12 n=1 Tax=Aliarcobacter thereius TaxID=544718 RepID=A0A5R9GWL5_9BACT|nr:type II-B CRISPR-associated RNA-guided endonuclease Cas9/Csx12 [Aliarcobacter thereius]TLS71017.1 type II-B CRISPR-associated RNA-guided endonuclease Cas9/Csx12 [Aliarcobacter thereius]